MRRKVGSATDTCTFIYALACWKNAHICFFVSPTPASGLPYHIKSHAVLHTYLPLALLLRRHNLERGRTRLLLRSSGWPLLRDLAPCPTTLTLPRITRRRPKPCHPGARTGAGNLALVGEFTAADEFFGKAAPVEGLRGGVDGVGDDVEFGGENEELGDEAVDCD